MTFAHIREAILLVKYTDKEVAIYCNSNIAVECWLSVVFHYGLGYIVFIEYVTSYNAFDDG